jgi:hypothetical protein
MASLHIKEIINSVRGKYVLSLLLGLGLATLFRKACKDRNCLVFKAPKMSDIKGKIFGYNNKCYKYNEKNASCNPNPENVVLEVEN